MADEVRVLARWDGYCGACRHDARPLVLTLAVRRGLAAFWQGVAWEDGSLSLTCRVCGAVQHVPWDEQDDPETARGHVPVLAVPAPRAPQSVDLLHRELSPS